MSFLSQHLSPEVDADLMNKDWVLVLKRKADEVIIMVRPVITVKGRNTCRF